MTAGPPLPPAHLAPWIGQYGGASMVLDIFEDGARMLASGAGFCADPFDCSGAGHFTEPRSGRVLHFGRVAGRAVVSTGAETYLRCDFGAEQIAQFQMSLAPGAFATPKPPARSPAGQIPDLVAVLDVAPSIKLDIRYATDRNFTGLPIYDRACAYVRPIVAEALARVQLSLAASGYGLLLFDAYRPWSATDWFWNIVPHEFRAFVADPAVGSRHNRGCAVDVSLCHAPAGEEVEMPSWYDEPSLRSHHDYRGGTSRQRWHRDLLRIAMEKQGFTVHPAEWWHFDFHAWQDYPIEDVAFADLDISHSRRDLLHPKG